MVKGRGFCGESENLVGVLSFQGSPCFQFASKLKALKLDLKKWNAEELGNVEDKMKKLWKNLEVLDLLEDSRPLSYDETLEKERLRIDLEKVTLMVEICWRQKSGPFGSERGIETLSSFIEQQTPTKDLIL